MTTTLLALSWLFVVALGGGQQPSPPGLAPEATLQRVGTLLNAQDLDAAKSAVNAALSAYPNDPALHNFAGVIDAQHGASDSAESHFKTAIRLAPTGSPSYENLGRLYQERSAKDPAARQKALDTYRRLLAFDPDNGEGLYQSAFLLALDGRFADSLALVQRLPDQVRHWPPSLVIVAADLAATGDRTGSAAAVHELEGHPDLTAPDVLALLPAFNRLTDDEVAEGLLEALDARGLATPAALQRLGEIYTRRQRYADARAVLERAVASGGLGVPVLVDLARAADKMGDHEGALGYLAHARDLEPANANVHFMFGIICVELDLVREAYESLKKAVELAPDNPLVNYAMGAVSVHRHEPAESLPYFEKYVKLVPDDPRGRFALGAARFTSGDFEGAARDLHDAAEHSETAAGAHYFLARLARQANDIETARREVDDSLRAFPGNADAWAELGLIETRAGHYQDAERSLDKALEIDRDNYLATVNLTALYTRTKDPRRDAQAARLAEVQKRREEKAQDFLRIIEVVP